MTIQLADAFHTVQAPFWSQPMSVTNVMSHTGLWSANPRNIFGYNCPAPTTNAAFVSFWLYMDTYGVTSNVVVRHNAGGNGQSTLQFDTATGHIILRRGITGDPIIATSTAVMPLNQWNHFEYLYLCSDSGGRAVVNVNDVNFIDFTGDTRNAGSTNLINSMSFNSTPVGWHWDDFVYANDIVARGDLRVDEGSNVVHHPRYGWDVLAQAPAA